MIAKHLEMSKKSRNFAALMPMTMNKFIQFLTMLSMMTAALTMQAADYTTLLTPARGFTEVTSFNDIVATPDYYYMLASAESTGLVVSIGRYEVKPDWASEESKALRYTTADETVLLDCANFFTIEKDGNYIGLRNVVYSTDLFQTHKEAGYMYVNTYTDKNLDEWSWLIPTFQDGYWLFENGKYPMSSEAQWKGYMGSWTPGRLENGEPIALNRLNTNDDPAGHYRLFRIVKADYESMFKEHKMQLLLSASVDNPVDATWLITNPSFEMGTVGWTVTRTNPDDTVLLSDLRWDEASECWASFDGNTLRTKWDDTKIADYGMTNKKDGYLFNAYAWWASTIGIQQTIADVPDGVYELTATLCTFDQRKAYLSANTSKASITGTGDGDGIDATTIFSIYDGNPLTIMAYSNTDWWSQSGIPYSEREKGFFKVDNFRLICKGISLNALSLPLPNNNTTVLVPDQWYYYDAAISANYRLSGNITDMVYTTSNVVATASISSVQNILSLPRGRVYFKTGSNDATLLIECERELKELTFTAVALNVDGLPSLINNDGPGSSGTTQISSYIESKSYDMIGFSEDFDFHDELKSNMYSYSWGSYRGSVNALNLLVAADTDGLEFAWKKSKVSMDNESWTKWNHSESGDGNQYIKKGFRHYDVTMNDDEGNDAVIDVYILHMDAGDVVSSREQQWTQLANTINNADSSRPKLVIGDTNSRWTRENITANFFSIVSDKYQVGDSWVDLCRGAFYDGLVDESGEGWGIVDNSNPSDFGRYEVVDKIIYLNPKQSLAPQLVPKSYRLELDYVKSDGTQLGDHKPVVVEFLLVKSGKLITLMGDVNRDGKVDIADLTALVNYLITHKGDYDLEAADMNHDGDVTTDDVEPLVNLLLAE